MRPVMAFSCYPSASRAFPFLLRNLHSGFAIHEQARQLHAAESSSSSYRLAVLLQLLPTPPHGDAVTFGYRPESICLKRTFTSLSGCAHRRTSGRSASGYLEGRRRLRCQVARPSLPLLSGHPGCLSPEPCRGELRPIDGFPPSPLQGSFTDNTFNSWGLRPRLFHCPNRRHRLHPRPATWFTGWENRGHEKRRPSCPGKKPVP